MNDDLMKRIQTCFKAGYSFAHHECSICDEWVYWICDGTNLYFDPNCGCLSRLEPRRLCDWNEELGPYLSSEMGPWPERFDAWASSNGF